METFMRYLTKENEASQEAYDNAKSDTFGDLHQRMQAVIDRANAISLWESDPALWDAIHNLELEVSFYQPAKPPYAKRCHRHMRPVKSPSLARLAKSLHAGKKS